jgi:hypothetical protein
MMRARVCAVMLMCLLVVAACSSPGKSSDDGVFELQVDLSVPSSLARSLDGQMLREGRNQVATFMTGRLWAVIANGELDSLVLEEDGQPPTVVSLVADPAPPMDGEIPQNCGQRFNNCVRGCEGAPDQACCECRCLVSYLLCERRQGRTLMTIR